MDAEVLNVSGIPEPLSDSRRSFRGSLDLPNTLPRHELFSSSPS